MVLADACAWEGGKVLPSAIFSLAMSLPRQIEYRVAWNTDGVAMRMNRERMGQNFVLDLRIPAGAQTGNDLYAGSWLDHGQLAWRADAVWEGMRKRGRPT